VSRPIRKNQLYHLVAAHSREVSRQPAVLFWGIIFPILIALGLGVAFTRKTETVRNVAVIEQVTNGPGISAIDRFLEERTTRTSSGETDPRAYRLTLNNEKLGDTTFVFTRTDWPTAMIQLKRGRVAVVMDAEEDGTVVYHFDPMNPDAQLTYLKLSRLAGGEAPPGTTGQDVAPLTLAGTRYIDFLIPGLISMGIMMSCMWGLGYGMIDKRAKKLLRRMVATPMKKSYFLIAQMSVRIGMNFVESGLLFLAALLIFDISIQGSIPALLLVFLAGNIAFGGLAILTASHTANTEVGNGLINAVVMPMTVLSGIFFSYQNFPDWSIPIIQVFPLTLLADGLRSVFIEGAGIADIAIPATAMLGMGVVFFAAGLKVFKWH